MDVYQEQKLIELLTIYPSLIVTFKNKYITDNMWRVAIESEPALFKHMKNPSEEMILFALSEDGVNIKYLKEMGVAITPKMIYTAVKSYPGAIYLIPKELRTTKLKEFACIEDPSLMRDLQLRKEFINKRLQTDPRLIRYVKNPTEEQICNSLMSDRNTIIYITEYTPKIKEIIKEIYPDMIPLIPELSDEL